MRRCSKAVQGDAPAGGGGGGRAHSLSTSKRAAQWAPNPATNLEWADWQDEEERGQEVETRLELVLEAEGERPGAAVVVPKD